MLSKMEKFVTGAIGFALGYAVGLITFVATLLLM